MRNQLGNDKTTKNKNYKKRLNQGRIKKKSKKKNTTWREFWFDARFQTLESEKISKTSVKSVWKWKKKIKKKKYDLTRILIWRTFSNPFPKIIKKKISKTSVKSVWKWKKKIKNIFTIFFCASNQILLSQKIGGGEGGG